MPQQNVSQGAAAMSSFIPIILIFGVFYFLIIRPQSKKQKEHQKMVDNLKKGDRIVTLGGMYGTVVDVQDNIVKIKIAENVNVQIMKSAVSAVISDIPKEVVISK
jgi:preprotein translocase subunit YajC